MPRKNEQVINRLLNQAWALHPDKLQELALLAERRLSGEETKHLAEAGKSGNRAEDRYEVRDGVAILKVYGMLDKRMNLFMRFSGGTSTELLARDFRQAQEDPEVRAILLDVDSPGGAVDGTKPMADLVFEARGRGKPVVAYANGLMASAAYWIGSAANTVVAPETAEIGSIGVAFLHLDYSGADAQAGIKRTFITGGKYKRIASDEKPLSQEGREYLQALVDEYYDLFVEAVGRQRRADPETVQSRMADGRIFIGKKARKAGLIDQIGNFEDALALAREQGVQFMKNLTMEQLQAENPDLYQQILAAGAAGVTLENLLAQNPQTCEQLRAAGHEAGVQTERERAAKILTRAGLKGITLAAIQEGLSYEAALEKFLDHQDKVKAEALAALGAQASMVVGTTPVQVEEHTETGTASIETRAKAAWDKDPQLQQEFTVFETYLAFFRAEEAGLAKIKTG